MGSQGVPMAVDEINKAGGFKVGDKTYKIELISLDTRGDPKEATIQLKRLLEQDKARFVFGPFLSNVFVTVLPYAKQFNGKFLLMGGGNAHARFRRHSPSTTSSSAPGTGMPAPTASASGWSTT